MYREDVKKAEEVDKMNRDKMLAYINSGEEGKHPVKDFFYSRSNVYKEIKAKVEEDKEFEMVKKAIELEVAAIELKDAYRNKLEEERAFETFKIEVEYEMEKLMPKYSQKVKEEKQL